MTEKNIGKDQVRLLVLLLTYNEKRVGSVSSSSFLHLGRD
jgi:hypothetical protein